MNCGLIINTREVHGEKDIRQNAKSQKLVGVISKKELSNMKNSLFSQTIIPLLMSIVFLWNFIPVLIKWKKGEEILSSIKALAVFGTLGAVVILGLVVKNLL